MWWILLLLGVVLLVWVHCAYGMSVRDRIDVALDIMRSAKFSPAEGFENAAREDPSLVGWIQDGSDCVMLFRSSDGDEVEDIVDFASGSFHPGLIIRYKNGTATRAGQSDITDHRVRKKAAQLLYDVRRAIESTKSSVDFGFRD